MSISQNLAVINQKITDKVVLVAVSKTYPTDAIQQAYDSGQRDFGENKVQEMVEKHALLPGEIRWHLIGHLQTNKVKYIAPFVHLIHAVDSIKLLKEIDKRAGQNKRIIDCLLQVHIAKEEAKFGFDNEELLIELSTNSFSNLKNIRIKGLMGMATNSSDLSQIKLEFEGLKVLFDQIKNSNQQSNLNMKILSMGMSSDYEIAIASGSNMVRIGSSIFGVRDYSKS